MRLFEGTEFDVPPRCDRCNELEADCQCEPIPEPKLPPSEQKAVVSSEKRKRGKMVTVVRGLAAHETDLAELTTDLKNHCGAGGTVKPDERDETKQVIEIQGDQASRVAARLTELGYNVKQR